MRRGISWFPFFAIACLAMLGTSTALAWSNHALCTWAAVSAIPQMQAMSPVEVERLERFLVAEREGIATLLEAEEAWARANVPGYPPRPASLAFRADDAAPEVLRQRFVAAVRINPNARLALFRQLPPGALPDGPRLAEADLTPLKDGEAIKLSTFVGLREGQRVAPIDVLATASDEPDYGLDIGLWADNGTAHGARYGFGRQPFGNPATELSSQAPLHMGFYHESPIVYQAAPFLARTLPVYRIHLWQSLARHALRTGHSYWGWRFAGWALHYLQDLAQPYHARVLPGVSVARMLWVNALDLAGMRDGKTRAINLVTNRHFALENFELHLLRAGYLHPERPNGAIRALRDTSTDATLRHDDTTPRTLISRQAFAASDAIDAALEAALPARMVSDPDYVFGKTDPGIDLLAQLAAAPARQHDLTAALTPLLRDVGGHTRAFLRALLADAKGMPPDRPPGY